MIYGYDTISKATQAAGTYDDNGDYTPGDETWGDELQCDAEPAGKANASVYTDGKRVNYAYEVSLDISAPDFAVGDRVKLKRGDDETAVIYDVLGFHRYAYICKVWL